MLTQSDTVSNVKYAEDGRIGADPESQRHHRDDEKHRLARQDTKGQTKVLEEHIG